MEIGIEGQERDCRRLEGGMARDERGEREREGEVRWCS
jgi:hypothetical protein